MAVTTWLIGKSAYTRIAESPDAPIWIDRFQQGRVRISTITRLEIGYSFRTAAEGRREAVSPPLALVPIEYLTPAIEDRVVELQLLLATGASIVRRRYPTFSSQPSQRWPASPSWPWTRTSS